MCATTPTGHVVMILYDAAYREDGLGGPVLLDRSSRRKTLERHHDGMRMRMGHGHRRAQVHSARAHNIYLFTY